jgi:N-acetylneuraminate lyase
MLLPASVMKIDGAIGSTFNVNGKRAKQIFEYGRNGEIDKAYDIQKGTNDLITEILGNGLYQTIKELLKTKGVDAGYCKKPLKRLDDEAVENAKRIAERHMK